MAGAQQPVMVPGQIEYKRKYTLWILILLIIVCWPIAIIYYFTREKVPVQEYHTYGAPMGYPPQAGGAPPPAAAGGGKFCSACGTQNPPNAQFCAKCGKPL